MNKFFALLGFDPAKHSVRVELMAGLTTFLTVSYILADAIKRNHDGRSIGDMFN